MTEPHDLRPNRAPLWVCVLTPTLAGGLGWGIRGIFGHESGAMMPGVLIAVTIGMLALPRMSGLRLARFVAIAAVAFSFGGSMTYGQTLGLSHDAGIREQAYWWGLLGTTVKGAIWIGLAGGFMGVALSRRRYTAGAMVGLLVVMIVLWVVGVWALNTPLDREAQQVPRIYFSDYWGVGQDDWKPRQELWGGLGAALLGLLVYLGAVRRDARAVGLLLFGLVAGGAGFTVGQSIQAYMHAHAPWPNAEWAPYIGAWKTMEITFGLVAGFGLSIGCLLLYGRVDFDRFDDEVGVEPSTELIWLAVMAVLMFLWNVRSYGWVDVFADVALTMGIVPIACMVGGRIWPFLGATAYVTLPIAAKTAQRIVEEEGVLSEPAGQGLFFFLPVIVMILAGVAAMQRAARTTRCGSTGMMLGMTSLWAYTLLSLSRTIFNKRVFFPTAAQQAEAGSALALVVETLRAALVVQIVFLVLAVLITVLLWRFRPRTPELRPEAHAAGGSP